MVDRQRTGSAPHAAIEVSILGPLEVREGGAVVSLPGRRHALLLVDLVVASGRRVPTDVLVDHLWRESAPSSATKTVHKYVSEIRRALGIGLDGVLVTDGAGYLLRLPSDAVDAERFEAHVAASRRLAHADAVKFLEKAESEWRGAALEGYADLDWAQPSAERLEELRLTASERRLGLLVALGRADEAILELEQLVIENPLREELCAHLMLALAHSGRRSDALAAYQRLRRGLGGELGIEPSSRLRDIELLVLNDELVTTDAPMLSPSAGEGSTGPVRRRTVPTPVSSFVGRADLLERVTANLGTSRLVTLTGAGGSGKTRVAVEVGKAAGCCPDRDLVFVDLSVIDAAELVLSAVADAKGLPDQPGTELTVLVQEFLSSRPTLLILDNCEHLLASVANVANVLLSSCPELGILATSREPLGIAGEHVLPVPPLNVPGDDASAADADRAEAVQLLAVRAREADPSFEIGEGNWSAVVDICRRLDGMPLAIELAAAQLRALSPADIAAHLDDRFRLLTAPTGRPARHATLDATIDWSYGLLDPDEQQLFDRLAVFPAGFDTRAAAAVGGLEDAVAAALLTGLVRQSMVVRSGDIAGTARFRLLETLRTYARDRLVGTGDEDTCRTAHARHYAALTVRSADPPLEDGDRWHQSITVEYDNVRAALAHAVDHDPQFASHLVFRLSRYWTRTDQVVDGLRYVERLLEQSDLPPIPYAFVLCSAAELRAEHGEAVNAEREADQALAVFDAGGNIEAAARAKHALGQARGNGGDYSSAIELIAAARQVFAESDPLRWASGCFTEGYFRLTQGEYGVAAQLFDRVLTWANRHEMEFVGAKARWLLGATARHRGELAEARDLCERALAAFIELDDRSAVAHVRMTLGDIARLADDRVSATELYTDALEALSDIGDRRCIASVTKNLADLERRVDPGRAATLYIQSLDRRRALGDSSGAAEALEGLAGALADLGSETVGATLLGHADAIRSDTGSVVPEIERGAIDTTRARLASMIDANQLARALADGATMSLDEAFDTAASAAAVEARPTS